MSEYQREIAKIKSTFLGVEDHGMFSVNVGFTYDNGGSYQGTGHYALDRYDETLDRRVGSAEGMEFIIRLLNACGVSEWARLPGRTVFVLKDPGFNGLIRGIEPLPTEPGAPFIFADVFQAVQS